MLPTTKAARVFAIFSLIRWKNLIGIALLAIGSITWTYHPATWTISSVVGFILAATLLTASANARNDAFDLQIDRQAHPQRPLVTGVLSASAADTVATLCWVASVAAMTLVSLTCVRWFLLTATIVFFYDRLKRVDTFLGNLVVAACIGGVPLVAGLNTRQLTTMIAPAMLLALFNLMREMTKDDQDRAADRNGGRSMRLISLNDRRLIMYIGLVVGTFGSLVFFRAVWGNFYLTLICTVAFADSVYLFGLWRQGLQPSTSQRKLKTILWMYLLLFVLVGFRRLGRM